jgi:hypothetical protein
MQAAIPITTAEDLSAHLRSLGVRTGDHLTVHSRILSFGRIQGGVATVSEAAEALRAMEKYDTVLRDNVDLRANTLTSKLIAAIHEGDFDSETESNIQQYIKLDLSSFTKHGIFAIGYIRLEQLKRAKPRNMRWPSKTFSTSLKCPNGTRIIPCTAVIISTEL